MKFEYILSEWNECRNAIARFDNYLLRLRLLGFSVFTLIFTAISGLAGSRSVQAHFTIEAILFAISTLSLFVLAIYILDRYYERMLLISVLRASRLESHRLGRFRLGLTTEIEFQKEQLNKRSLRKFFSKASYMVNFVYFLIFFTMWSQYFILLEVTKVSYIYKVILFIMIFIVLLTAIIGHSLLREPISLIRLRSKIVQSPIIMSPEEINHCVSRLASEILQWLGKGKEIFNVFSILSGGRTFTEDLLKKLKEFNPKIEISLNLIRLEVKDKNETGSRECQIICGGVDKKQLSGTKVLIIDDFLDSGITLKKAKELVLKAGAKSVKTVVLIKKFEQSYFEPDFIGFNFHLNREILNRCGIKDVLLFGYGMDIEGHYREIGHIGWVEQR